MEIKYKEQFLLPRPCFHASKRTHNLISVGVPSTCSFLELACDPVRRRGCAPSNLPCWRTIEHCDATHRRATPEPCQVLLCMPFCYVHWETFKAVHFHFRTGACYMHQLQCDVHLSVMSIITQKIPKFRYIMSQVYRHGSAHFSKLNLWLNDVF